MTEPKKHGGKRLGSGRKTLAPDGGQKRRNITLSDALAEKARRIGAGNLSEGIRLALEQYREKP